MNSRTVVEQRRSGRRRPSPHNKALVHDPAECLRVGRKYGFGVGKTNGRRTQETFEQLALAIIQECVAPLDRRGERAMSLGGVRAALHSTGQAGSRAAPRALPGRRASFAPRQARSRAAAVEAFAQLADLFGLRVEVYTESARPFCEERRCVARLERPEDDLDLAREMRDVRGLVARTATCGQRESNCCKPGCSDKTCSKLSRTSSTRRGRGGDEVAVRIEH